MHMFFLIEMHNADLNTMAKTKFMHALLIKKKELWPKHDFFYTNAWQISLY